MDGVYEMARMMVLMFGILPFLIVGLALVTILRGVSRQGGDRPRPPVSAPRKVTSPADPASQMIRRTEARMDRLDVQHEREDCTFSYSTQDPTFSFNGRQVVDELAELRRKNEAHERHLLARVHRD